MSPASSQSRYPTQKVIFGLIGRTAGLRCAWTPTVGDCLSYSGWLTERGFECLVDAAWSFPYLEGHVLGVLADLDDIALIDEGGGLFNYPLSGLPPGWYEHLMRERSCLLITGMSLHLATEGMAGIEHAVRRGDAYGGMVLINEALD